MPTEPAPILLRPRHVRALLGGVAKSTLYAWIAAGHIPAPVRIGTRAVAFHRTDIERFIAERGRTHSPRDVEVSVPAAG